MTKIMVRFGPGHDGSITECNYFCQGCCNRLRSISLTCTSCGGKIDALHRCRPGSGQARTSAFQVHMSVCMCLMMMYRPRPHKADSQPPQRGLMEPTVKPQRPARGETHQWAVRLTLKACCWAVCAAWRAQLLRRVWWIPLNGFTLPCCFCSFPAHCTHWQALPVLQMRGWVGEWVRLCAKDECGRSVSAV